MPELYTLHRLTLNAPGEHLFAVLATAVEGLSRHQARRTVVAGLVKVDGVTVLEPKHVLGGKPARCEVDLRHGFKRALHARIHDGAAIVNAKPFTVLYSDQHLLVVDKTAGVLSAPARHEPGSKPVHGHLPELIRRMYRKQGKDPRYIGVVHRLDQDTSGCICFAMSREAHRLLGVQFAGEAAGRIYRCLVQGGPRQDRDTIRGVMARGGDGKRRLARAGEEGKEAVTHFRVLRRLGKGSELEVTLETGRTHQIRVTLGALGCPVFGDRVYGFKPKPGMPPLPKAPRLMLHAWKLALDHPITGKRLEIEAPVPKEFTEFARQLA
jgi:23S rRNA pseudouridine1911/1915/1917 synthase